jgi:hypothetical protein
MRDVSMGVRPDTAQGDGRTADTDRPVTFATMGGDIAALLDHLKTPKPTWSAIRMAAQVRSARQSSTLTTCAGWW